MKKLLLLVMSTIMLLTATACGETKYASNELAIYGHNHTAVYKDWG